MSGDCRCGHAEDRHLPYVLEMQDACSGGTPGFCGCSGYRPAAPVVQGADELRDDAWWTRVFLAVQELVDSVPYADGSKYPVPHAAAFRAAVEPELMRLLAERDQAVAQVAEVRQLLDTAERMPAVFDGRLTVGQIRRALDGDQ